MITLVLIKIFTSSILSRSGQHVLLSYIHVYSKLTLTLTLTLKQTKLYFLNNFGSNQDIDVIFFCLDQDNMGYCFMYVYSNLTLNLTLTFKQSKWYFLNNFGSSQDIDIIFFYFDGDDMGISNMCLIWHSIVMVKSTSLATAKLLAIPQFSLHVALVTGWAITFVHKLTFYLQPRCYGNIVVWPRPKSTCYTQPIWKTLNV